MIRAVEYGVLFVAAVLLQVFLFDNLDLSVYIHPVFFIVFLLLLPIGLGWGWTVLLGALLGLTMDFFTGSEGLYTIACTALGFVRPWLLTVVLGRETVHEGGVPTSRILGEGRYFKFSSVAILFYCIVFFCFESMSLSHLPLILLRIVLSAAVTVVLVFFFQLLFFNKPGSRQ